MKTKTRGKIDGLGGDAPTNGAEKLIEMAVAAYDNDGHYVGANDWIFYCGQEQVWRIDRVNRPQP